jgi:hypothetical protein
MELLRRRPKRAQSFKVSCFRRFHAGKINPAHLISLAISPFMRRSTLMNSTRLLLSVVAAMIGGGFEANPTAAMAPRYTISPGSTYTYKPSPFLGIPGGVPSEYHLDFGIFGTFGILATSGSPSAPGSFRFTDLDLTLTGNEAIQANPPSYAAVTPQSVADWLASRQMVNVPSVPEFSAFRDETVTGLMAQDFDVRLTISGGFDIMPVDGTAMLFNITAVPVPEPGSAVVATLAVLAVFRPARVGKLRLLTTFVGRCAR